MQKYFSRGIILFIFFGIFSQCSSLRKYHVALSRQQILDLKHSALLVRLQTKNKSISELRKFGKNNYAGKLEAEQQSYNKEIIRAFKENFNFCPVYFFLSDYSQQILDKQLDKVAFLNEDLLPDSTIKFNNNKFLTAEFCVIEQDTARYFAGYHLDREKQYYGGTSMGFGALIIKSDRFVQLYHPFPFYTRTFEALLFLKRTLADAVAMQNEKLNDYYRKHSHEINAQAAIPK